MGKIAVLHRTRKSTEDTFRYFGKFRPLISTLIEIHNKVQLPFKSLMDYILKERHVQGTIYTERDWNDYLSDCRKLQYDLSDTSVTMPRDLYAAHQRTTEIIRIENDRIAAEEFAETNKARIDLPFTDEEKGLEILLPESVEDIVKEGRALSHCVGGYAERHASGKLHILFCEKQPSRKSHITPWR